PAFRPTRAAGGSQERSGRGYLIASSQGNNTYKVYERAGANRYVLTIDPEGAGIDGVSDTDGIEVTSCATSRPFAQGRVHRAGRRERRRQPEFQALRVGRHRRSESADRYDVPSQTSGLGGSGVIGATERERGSMWRRCHANVVAGPRSAGSPAEV